MSESEISEIIEFIRSQIPIKLDMRIKDLKYDKNNIYYKILKYIMYLREKTEDKWH